MRGSAVGHSPAHQGLSPRSRGDPPDPRAYQEGAVLRNDRLKSMEWIPTQHELTRAKRENGISVLTAWPDPPLPRELGHDRLHCSLIAANLIVNAIEAMRRRA